MTSAAPSPADVLDAIDALGPPGTPVTTPEVAEPFDCTDRTVYNKLDALVETDQLLTKKVGARGRVWWRPPRRRVRDGGSEAARQTSTPAEGPRLARDHERADGRAEVEAALARTESWLAEILQQQPAAIGVLDTEGRYQLMNESMHEVITGEVSPSMDPSQQDNWFAKDEDGGRLPPERWPGPRALHGERVTPGIQFRYEGVGDDRWMTVSAVPYREDGEVAGAIVVAQDVTERVLAERRLRESEERLRLAIERLNTASRMLVDASTETISDHIAELTRDVLDVEFAALWRYDGTTGALRSPSSQTSETVEFDGAPLPDEFTDRAWQTFIGDETHVDNAVDGSPMALRSLVFVPLARHGVICAGSTRDGAFDERMVDLAETVATTVETAWDRVDSEQALARQNDELTRLDRLNRLIRRIDQVLVEADTVEAIDEAVCERLATSELFEFAWIGEYDATAAGVTPRAWSGVDGRVVGEVARTTDEADANPVGDAIRTGETQVVADVATDPRAVPWREVALERGGRSCLSIPLAYEGSLYGVLTVYVDHPQTDARDLELMEELGQTIAHSINALETRATLRTDAIVQLTLRSRGADTPLVQLARQTGGEIESEGLVPGRDGKANLFFTVRGCEPAAVRAGAEAVLGIEDLTCIADRGDGSLFRMRVSEPTIAAALVQQPTIVRTLTIDERGATAVLDLPQSTDVRTVVERLEQSVPDLALLGRRTSTRSLASPHGFQTTCDDRLTDRQREVLYTAYLCGFFETPREMTGQEVTRLLGISQPTFSQHLRAAERTICAVFFEDE